MRVISLSQVRWFFSLLSEQWWIWSFSDKLVEFRIERVRKFRVYVDGIILEDRCVSLWVVEVVDHVRAHNLWEEVVLATGPHSSSCGSSQGLLIGNLTWEVVLDEGIEEEDVSVKGVEWE